jgi:hypothetical protein
MLRKTTAWLSRLWRRRPRLRRVDRKITYRVQAKLENINHKLDNLDQIARQQTKRLDDIEWRLAGLENKALKKSE